MAIISPNPMPRHVRLGHYPDWSVRLEFQQLPRLQAERLRDEREIPQAHLRLACLYLGPSNCGRSLLLPRVLRQFTA